MDTGIRVDHVIKYFFENNIDYQIKPFGSGLIHRTFFLQHPEGDFILQKMNHHIFKNPKVVMQNIDAIAHHLTLQNYPKSILKIRKTLNGSLLLENSRNESWRIFKFIPSAHTYDKTNSAAQAYEVGKGFGAFLFYLRNLPKKKIYPTLPHFHDIRFRWKKLENTILKDKHLRVQFAIEVITQIRRFDFLLQEFEALDFPERIVHADPKINNLLFGEKDKVKAIIDWDTIMVGKIIFDFGDLVRTCCCSENEESTNFSKIKIIPNYYKALKKGFLEETETFLLDIEKNKLLLGARLIIWEQAIRFLTDFLEGDKYYLVHQHHQNLNRAKNQMKLIQSLF